ncbi:hypothetical protein D3C79_880400 [compost metagenome]
MLNQQHLQSLLRRCCIEQEVQVFTHGRNFLVFTDVRLVIATLRIVGSADLVESEEPWNRRVHLGQVLLKRERQGNVDGQVVFIRARIR